MKREAKLVKAIWMNCILIALGCIFLAIGCAHVQTESQPVSESSSPSQIQAATKEPPTPPAPEAEQVPPKRTESAKFNGLQVKEKPQKNSRTIAILKKGEPVEIRDESGNWVNVITQGGQDGWVDSSGLTGFAEALKPQVPSAAATPVKAKQAVKPATTPAKTDSAPKVSDSTSAPPRVSDSDVPSKTPISDAQVKPKVSDSE